MLWDTVKSWKAFSASCWLWTCFPCKKLLRFLKNWLSVRERSGECSKMRQNFLAQIIQLLKCWCVICGWGWLTVVTEKNWFLSAIFHGFSSVSWAYISYVIVSQDLETCSGSDGQQTTSNCELFLVQLALGRALELLLSPATELIIHCRLLYKTPLFVSGQNRIKKWVCCCCLY